MADAEKLEVFISYSRDDLDFADQLEAALKFAGFAPTLDRHGISGGEDWKRRLGNLILSADTIVFVLSPTSARSEICAWEVKEAVRLGKRILPVVCRDLAGQEAPTELAGLNYILFYAEPKVPGSGFGTGLIALAAALSTDLEWLREHTRLLERATEWLTGGRPSNRLLSGADIVAAKAWAARRPKDAPQLTPLHLDFIRASEDAETARLDEARQQVERMAAAQEDRAKALAAAEDALKQAADAQQRRIRLRNMALAGMSMVAALAIWLGWQAERQREDAEIARAQAVAQEERAKELFEGANNILATLMRRSELDPEIREDAREIYERGTQLGSEAAMHNLGWLYHNGWGVPQDLVKASEWYEKAASKGVAFSMNNLGLLYANGWGVPRDYVKAREWYEKAAAKDMPIAMATLGEIYLKGLGVAKDYAKAREWYEKAAAKDNELALENLGVIYLDGLGVTKDYVKAREWLEKAAAKGMPGAMNNLGLIYTEGWGVPQDYVKAREWYEKAAAKGKAIAMLNLGNLYENGHGVAKDYVKAREWNEKAAAAIEKDETASKGQPGEETALALNSVSWVALLAGSFDRAAAASERALTLAPAHFVLKGNRAHALMFLGRVSEAKVLYLAHKGQQMPEIDNRVWEDGIGEDFKSLREAGLTHPMMDEIEKELGIRE